MVHDQCSCNLWPILELAWQDGVEAGLDLEHWKVTQPETPGEQVMLMPQTTFKFIFWFSVYKKILRIWSRTMFGNTCGMRECLATESKVKLLFFSSFFFFLSPLSLSPSLPLSLISHFSEIGFPSLNPFVSRSSFFPQSSTFLPHLSFLHRSLNPQPSTFIFHPSTIETCWLFIFISHLKSLVNQNMIYLICPQPKIA